MKHLVEAYIKDHETAWASSTLKSEAARLRQLDLNQSPEQLFNDLKAKGKKPYTIKTTFIRVCGLEKWAKLEPKFQRFMEKHVRKFRHLYVKEEVKISYEEALRRIESLEDGVREHALSLLNTGVRLSESYSVHDGKVVGKGGKVRKVYGTIKETVPKVTLSRKLKAVGLKPHTLRKLCATRMAENGASAADLCKVFGWEDITTAYQYLQPKEDSRLESLMAKSEEE